LTEQLATDLILPSFDVTNPCFNLTPHDFDLIRDNIDGTTYNRPDITLFNVTNPCFKITPHDFDLISYNIDGTTKKQLDFRH